jgi:hypothetical protein
VIDASVIVETNSTSGKSVLCLAGSRIDEESPVVARDMEEIFGPISIGDEVVDCGLLRKGFDVFSEALEHIGQRLDPQDLDAVFCVEFPFLAEIGADVDEPNGLPQPRVLREPPDNPFSLFVSGPCDAHDAARLRFFPQSAARHDISCLARTNARGASIIEAE